MKANKVYIKSRFSILGLVFKLSYILILLAIGFLLGGLYMSPQSRSAIRSSSLFSSLLKYEYFYKADKLITAGLDSSKIQQAENIADANSEAKASLNANLVQNTESSLSKEIALVFPEFELSALDLQQQEKIKSLALKNVMLTSNPLNFTNEQIDAIVQKSLDKNLNPLLTWAIVNSKDSQESVNGNGIFKINLELASAFAKLEGKATSAMELNDFQYGLDFGLRRIVFFYEVYSKDKILTLLAENYSNSVADTIRDTRQALSFDQIAYLTKVHEKFSGYSETLAAQKIGQENIDSSIVTEASANAVLNEPETNVAATNIENPNSDLPPLDQTQALNPVEDLSQIKEEAKDEIKEEINQDLKQQDSASVAPEILEPTAQKSNAIEQIPDSAAKSEIEVEAPKKQAVRPMKKIVSDLISAKILQSGVAEARKEEILASIAEQCSINQLDPIFSASIIMQESTFNPDAVSKNGKLGLLQIHPLEASNIAALAKVELQAGKSLLDVDHNLKIGVSYLAFLNKLFRGNKEHVALAYNMGVKQFLNAAKTRSPIPAEASAYKTEVMTTYVNWLRELTPVKPVQQKKQVPLTKAKPAQNKQVSPKIMAKPMTDAITEPTAQSNSVPAKEIETVRILDTKDLDKKNKLSLPPVQIVGVR